MGVQPIFPLVEGDQELSALPSGLRGLLGKAVDVEEVGVGIVDDDDVVGFLRQGGLEKVLAAVDDPGHFNFLGFLDHFQGHVDGRDGRPLGAQIRLEDPGPAADIEDPLTGQFAQRSEDLRGFFHG